MPFISTSHFSVDALRCTQHCHDLAKLSQPLEEILLNEKNGYTVVRTKKDSPCCRFRLGISKDLDTAISNCQIPDAHLMIEMIWLIFNVTAHIMRSVFHDRVVKAKQVLQFTESMLESVDTHDDFLAVLLQFLCAFPTEEDILLHKTRLRKAWIGYWDENTNSHASIFLEMTSLIATVSLADSQGDSDATVLRNQHAERCKHQIKLLLEFHQKSARRSQQFTKYHLNRSDRRSRNPDSPSFFYVSILAKIGQEWLDKFEPLDAKRRRIPAINYGMDLCFRHWIPGNSKLMMGRESIPHGIPSCLLILTDFEQESPGNQKTAKRRKGTNSEVLAGDVAIIADNQGKKSLMFYILFNSMPQHTFFSAEERLPIEYKSRITSAIELFSQLHCHFQDMKGIEQSRSRLPIRECELVVASATSLLDRIQTLSLWQETSSEPMDIAVPSFMSQPDGDDISTSASLQETHLAKTEEEAPHQETLQESQKSAMSQLSLDLSALSPIPEGFSQDTFFARHVDTMTCKSEPSNDDASSCSELSDEVGELLPSLIDDDQSTAAASFASGNSENSDSEDSEIMLVGGRRAGENIPRDNFGVIIPEFDSYETLEDGEWLNGDIIDWYMNRLNVGQAKLFNESTLYFGTNFMRMLALASNFKLASTTDVALELDYNRLRRHSRNRIRSTDSTIRTNLFDYERLFFPINVARSHWVGACVHVREKRIVMYDSMNYRLRMYGRLLRLYLKREFEAQVRTSTFHTKEWEIVCDTYYCPKQNNGYDCGIFVCLFAEYLGAGRELVFNQNHATEFRKEMRKEANKYKQFSRYREFQKVK